MDEILFSLFSFDMKCNKDLSLVNSIQGTIHKTAAKHLGPDSMTNSGVKWCLKELDSTPEVGSFKNWPEAAGINPGTDDDRENCCKHEKRLKQIRHQNGLHTTKSGIECAYQANRYHCTYVVTMKLVTICTMNKIQAKITDPQNVVRSQQKVQEQGHTALYPYRGPFAE